MPYAVISFVEIDSVYFQSRIGLEFNELNRNDWFDAYTILPESSEVYVIPDCDIDNRFREKSFVKSGPRIKFYAGSAIMIDDVKIGVLSIMDTVAHPSFSLEDKENLLDLGAAVAQLAKEKFQKSLNLSAERANIVVSMMHHLRTPMTSLNFATSLLCNDIQQIKADTLNLESIGDDNNANNNLAADGNNIAKNTETMETPPVEGKVATAKGDQNQSNDTDPESSNESKQIIPNLFTSFESSFNEINMALNQLNVLVDSSLSLGQAIIKCSQQDTLNQQLHSSTMSPLNNNNGVAAGRNSNGIGEVNIKRNSVTSSHHVGGNNNTNTNTTNGNNGGNSNSSTNGKFSECNLIDYLKEMFHLHLPIYNNLLDIEWIIETIDLCRGSHITFPDAIMLIVISTISHMSNESNSLGFSFSFQLLEDENDYEYPELSQKMLEGRLSVKIIAKDEKMKPPLLLTQNNHSSSSLSSSSSFLPPTTTGKQLSSFSLDPLDSSVMLTKQNFLSIDKILRAINGGSKEYIIDDISKLGLTIDGKEITTGNLRRTCHEFFIPCKILLSPVSPSTEGEEQKKERLSSSSLSATSTSRHNSKGNIQPPSQRIRFYRPPATNTAAGLNDGGIKVTFENPINDNDQFNSSDGQQRNKKPFGTDSPQRNNGKEKEGNEEKGFPLSSTLVNASSSDLKDPKQSMLTNSYSKSGDSNDSGSATVAVTIPPKIEPPKKLRVLVIEDTIPVQKLLTRWLQNNGCEVTCASNGKIGLDYLTSQYYNITFVDFLMVSTSLLFVTFSFLFFSSFFFSSFF
jgi:hypothetical protein